MFDPASLICYTSSFLHDPVSRTRRFIRSHVHLIFSALRIIVQNIERRVSRCVHALVFSDARFARAFWSLPASSKQIGLIRRHAIIHDYPSRKLIRPWPWLRLLFAVCLALTKLICSVLVDSWNHVGSVNRAMRCYCARGLRHAARPSVKWRKFSALSVPNGPGLWRARRSPFYRRNAKTISAGRAR